MIPRLKTKRNKNTIKQKTAKIEPNSILINNYSNSNQNKLESSKSIDKFKKEAELSDEKEYKENMDDFELKEFEYDKVIQCDKRTFIQIYFSFLKREISLIFAFFICDDFNLNYIKIARFIFLITSHMALNVFFFSDESMHKLFLNYGKYNFIQQIPQIVYTTIVSQLIEVFLCYLSLTDKYIYKIKNLTKSNHNNNKNEILKVINYMKIKLIIFFIFTSIFFGLYWYIITSFCAVYENTQVTFLKDSLLSFLIGIIYPFALYLLPSTLRITALRSIKKNKKILFKISNYIPLF